MSYTKRFDGRKIEEMRKTEAKLDVIKRADGSAMFKIGDTIAVAAVYGPRELHPKFLQNPEKGILRCNYSMMSFSVSERIRPGPNKRSMEISKVTEWALNPAVMIDEYPNTVVDVHISIPQADASTRCAGINAASMALAHAGIPMKDLITSVSIGKIDDQLVVDVNKKEEDHEEGEGATDMAMSFLPNSGRLTHIQLDGTISTKDLNKAIELGQEICKKIYEAQKQALKEIKTESEGGKKK